MAGGRRALMGPHLPEPERCPTCGLRPVLGLCEPWPKDAGAQPWYAICYSLRPIEHCVGVNGDSFRDAVEKWNAEVHRP